jgi:amino acid transporter
VGFGRIKRYLIGDPLSTEMMSHERIPKWKALAVLSSDALSSVAYATEEVLIPLAAFASAAVAWSMPIAIGIGILLLIITISYRQTIDSYPGGGGAYTVARENLGVHAGLVAGAALLIDYVLTVAVSVAAGVENIASAFPLLLAHKEGLGIAIIIVIMLFNLRGIRESANIFAIPTYLFVFSFLILIGTGIWRLANGEVPPAAPIMHEVYPSIPVFLLLRAFASGCAALTGIEAISNGIPIFKEPAGQNAKTTMAWMSIILGGLFLSITLLAHLYGVVPGEGETAVSLLAHRIFPDSIFYYVIQGSTMLILVLAANTSYADFPRLSSLLAKDRYLPRQLASLGDRLVFSNGIAGLSLAAIFLIILFKGDTHHLIPLYAVGVFLSFTLSQLGMVIHHIKYKQPRWRRSLVFNLVGAITTAIVLVVIGATKFLHGAWMVILLIPLLVMGFKQIHRHYVYTAQKLARSAGAKVRDAVHTLRHTAIVPVSGIHQGVIDALSYAKSISKDVRACYVELNPEATIALKKEWADAAPNVALVVLKSPFRSVIAPIVDYIDNVEREMADDVVTVIIPEFVTARWYHQLLHNQTAIVLYAALRGRRDVVVTSVRYHLD